MSVTYIPKHFEFHGLKEKHDFIEKYNFGQLICTRGDNLNMSYVPFLLNRTDFPLGSLQCHVAKSNSIWRDITKGRITAIFSDHMLIFHRAGIQVKIKFQHGIILLFLPKDKLGCWMIINSPHF